MPGVTKVIVVLDDSGTAESPSAPVSRRRCLRNHCRARPARNPRRRVAGEDRLRVVLDPGGALAGREAGLERLIASAGPKVKVWSAFECGATLSVTGTPAGTLARAEKYLWMAKFAPSLPA